jgi:hypothetical protein
MAVQFNGSNANYDFNFSNDTGADAERFTDDGGDNYSVDNNHQVTPINGGQQSANDVTANQGLTSGVDFSFTTNPNLNGSVNINTGVFDDTGGAGNTGAGQSTTQQQGNPQSNLNLDGDGGGTTINLSHNQGTDTTTGQVGQSGSGVQVSDDGSGNTSAQVQVGTVGGGQGGNDQTQGNTNSESSTWHKTFSSN